MKRQTVPFRNSPLAALDRRPVLIGAVIALAATLAYVLYASTSGTAGTSQHILGIDPDLLLTTNGTTLERPPSDVAQGATVPEAEAIAAARSADPGYEVLDAELVLVNTPVVAADGCLCWAVSLYPPDGKLDERAPLGGEPGVRDTIYYLTFVDARSGELLYSAQGGRTVSPPRFDPSKLTPFVPPTGEPTTDR